MTNDISPRTVRFKAEEIDLIDEFLARNRFFDFSTLARIAILEFIKNPSVKIQPVAAKTRISRSTRSKEQYV